MCRSRGGGWGVTGDLKAELRSAIGDTPRPRPGHAPIGDTPGVCIMMTLSPDPSPHRGSLPITIKSTHSLISSKKDPKLGSAKTIKSKRQ